ncbi:hypothetical protein Tco_0718548 [Tanacetum coccineum]
MKKDEREWKGKVLTIGFLYLEIEVVYVEFGCHFGWRLVLVQSELMGEMEMEDVRQLVVYGKISSPNGITLIWLPLMVLGMWVLIEDVIGEDDCDDDDCDEEICH